MQAIGLEATKSGETFFMHAKVLLHTGFGLVSKGPRLLIHPAYVWIARTNTQILSA